MALALLNRSPSDFAVCKLSKTGGSVCESKQLENVVTTTQNAADDTLMAFFACSATGTAHQ